jgi:hypothetical protein
LGNAAKLQDLNCSITAKKPKAIGAVKRMEDEKEATTEATEGINEFSRFNGLERATSIVETLLINMLSCQV